MDTVQEKMKEYIDWVCSGVRHTDDEWLEKEAEIDAFIIDNQLTPEQTHDFAAGAGEIMAMTCSAIREIRKKNP
ncbi:MAG: hypothetical protein ACLTWO_01735 [Blautia massiliensis (ex Durand et al. 2017)]